MQHAVIQVSSRTRTGKEDAAQQQSSPAGNEELSVKNIQKKNFLVAKYIINTAERKSPSVQQEEGNFPYMDTGSGRNSFMGQPFVSVPVNTWFATPATFLDATWRQGIFSVMQALKAT